MGVPAKIGTAVATRDRPHLPASPLIALLEAGSPRFAWQRTARCPCISINGETFNADPDCPKCLGAGDYAYQPVEEDSAVVDRGTLDASQLALLVGAACIKGSLSGGMRNDTFTDQFGHWLSGRALITVRPENILGYHDRLVCLDSEIAYEEPVKVDPDTVGGATIVTRYPPTRVIRVESVETLYVEDADYELVDGVLRWRTILPDPLPPKVMVAYLCRPTYVVDAFPHAVRITQLWRGAASVMPTGTPEPLVLQTVVRLEFVKPAP